MTRIRNALFAIFFCVFLLGPAGIFFSDKASFNLPSWATAEDANYLLGSAGRTEVKQNLNIEGFQNERLQTNIEEAVNNHIPARENAILFNAATQKTAIEISNLLFSWNCYPTFYGSGIIYEPEHKTLRSNPAVSSKDALDKSLLGIRRFGDCITSFASANSDIKICVTVPNINANTPISPAWNLVSRKWAITDCISLWEDQGRQLDNLYFAYNKFDNYADYLRYYYASDDHWNGFGAITSYNLVADKVGIPFYAEMPPKISSLENYVFYGQLGRQGRMLIETTGRLHEPLFNTSTFEISDSISNAQVRDCHNLNENESTYASYNFYSWFYGVDASSKIYNPEAADNESVLIICDSFGDAFRWVTATKCSETYSIYNLSRADHDTNARLSDLIKQADCSKVVFVGSIINYSTFIERHPNYFQVD